jgi:hypothetical protein
MTHLIHWLEMHQLPCLYKEWLGIPCPGCGMQTAFIELLKGHLAGSIRTYPPLFPLLLVLCYLCLHLILRFKSGAIILKIGVIITAVIMMVNYVFVLIIH